MRPTIRDVAREAGVSIGTVSSVINGRSNVSDKTKSRVLHFIAELGFEPNTAARSLKTKSVFSIGVVVPDLRNPFFASLAEGVERGIGRDDVLLTLCITWSKKEREEYFARILRSQRLDGVIYLTGSGLPSPSLIELAETGLVVFVDEILPNVDAPSVTSDNRAGAKAIAGHVLDAGHTNIGIIGGLPGLWTSEQRLSGFREAIGSAGLDPDEMPYETGDYSQRSGYLAARRLLTIEAAKRPTAILCANDMMAMGVMRFCREYGISIPSQLSVTGFDDVPAAEFLFPALSTVSQPSIEMGRAAAELLLYKNGLRNAPPEAISFSTTVRIRHSVRRFIDCIR